MHGPMAVKFGINFRSNVGGMSMKFQETIAKCITSHSFNIMSEIDTVPPMLFHIVLLEGET